LPCASSVSAEFEDGRDHPPAKGEDEREAAVNPSAGAETAVTPPATSGPASAESNGVGSNGHFKVLRRENTLTLEGEVPETEKDALEALARTHFPSAALVSKLSIENGNIANSPDWKKTTTYAVELAARCEQGVVEVQQGVLNVDCETQTVSAKEAFNALLATRPTTLKDGLVNVLALDEVKSCEEALIKLVTRSQIRFTTNSAKLLPTSRPLLREIAHQLDRCPGVVVVEGHTDAQGVREENVTLSLNRARAVVSGLVGLGVPAARVRAEGFGPDQPLATNETATGRAQNRRIEFRVARTGSRGE
jgi:outer membrane protein OmpA-like peptidoglycan-associated protein